MSKTVKIAIDAMGGEDAPMKNIEGVRLFISKIIQKIFSLIFMAMKH